ncbi:hypothetical protein BIY37_04630 [Candidatus Brocadia sapporoensis]|uniref:Uncharacterized protein n=1 Tax=Candidatus Brocadia sapporoensis TaxID=392547 RepID=A0A1V6M1C6_9BACT|nr:YdbH domain-containing protein [Candidatus Brocadia sapporoensis]MDG6006258.1 hypothetical protein [Candidatus Brocadia sp.]OQD46190.1 hypothetical protein BIY37_04630 [Candidatus Brocadia sapporoensis]GJQ24632.1 MAG: hypothetical protein HBSAPP01_24220 [Candidatus Brocadia sapporoensis]
MKLIRKILIYSAVAVFIIIFLVCTAYVCIPVFLEKILLPRLAGSIGFTDSTCEVRKFSLNKLDMASIRWGESENPFLLTDSIRIDYSLPGLLRRHIKKIIVSGVEIRAEYKDGSIMVPGLDLENIFKNPADVQPENPENSQKQWSLVSFEEFEIRNATLLLTSGDTDVRVPFWMKAMPVTGDGKDNPAGLAIQMGLHLNFADSQTALNIAAQADIKSTVNFHTGEISMRLAFSGMNIAYQGCQVRNSPGDLPLIIELRKKQDVIHANVSRFYIASPLPVEMSTSRDADCRLRFSRKGMDVQGIIQVDFQKELQDTASVFGLKVTDSESIPVRFRGQKRGNIWHFCLNSAQMKKPLKFRRQTETVRFYPDYFSIKGKGVDSRGDVRFAMKLSDVAFDSDAVHVRSPSMLMYGNLAINSARSYLTRTFVKITGAEFKNGSLYAGKIDVKFPFQWPSAPREKELIKAKNKGERYFTITNVKYYGMDIGTIASTPYQDGMGIRFIGQYKDLFPEFSLDFSGRAGISHDGNFLTNIDFKASEPDKGIKIDPGKFSPQLAGIYFDGAIDMNGSCQIAGSTVAGNALISTRDSKIEIPSKKMLLEGIDLDLKLPDLYQFHSAPDQVLKFKRFAWGDIQMNEGEVSFQIESLSSFFLKKSSFSWCGGHVYTHGLQIQSGKRDLDIICYCDRLKLATLLQQFDIARAEGEGAVNGRIPVSYRDGKIKILDGFLYSTPGEGGTIRFHTDTLLSGASGVQQSIQMQIAQEALKNFSYDWAKLSLQSRNEDLLISMQMDGRPAGPLPFGFSKKSGLVKIEQPRANFQGIHFNINFKLPLDKMLYYGSGFSGLMHNK